MKRLVKPGDELRVLVDRGEPAAAERLALRPVEERRRRPAHPRRERLSGKEIAADVEVERLGEALRIQRLELAVIAVFLFIQRAVSLDDPAHVAGSMGTQPDGRRGGLRAEERLHVS